MINIAVFTKTGECPAFITAHRRLADQSVVVTVRSEPKLDGHGNVVCGDVAVIDIPPADWTAMVRRYVKEHPIIDENDGRS